MAIYPRIKISPVLAFRDNKLESKQDQLAIEEPLEITIEFPVKGILQRQVLAITMRTPGMDKELTTGFLFAEGLINTYKDVDAVVSLAMNNIVIRLNRDISQQLSGSQRQFYISSSCGICGKSSLEHIPHSKPVSASENDQPKVSPALICSLSQKLRAAQSVFRDTGGIHATGLFKNNGEMLFCTEDIGRHNALDKLIGHFLIKQNMKLNNTILMLSGRASFELIQKALNAGIPVVAAVGAPSSLAVELAASRNMTLLGFVGSDRFNVYSGAHRIVLAIK